MYVHRFSNGLENVEEDYGKFDDAVEKASSVIVFSARRPSVHNSIAIGDVRNVIKPPEGFYSRPARNSTGSTRLHHSY